MKINYKHIPSLVWCLSIAPFLLTSLLLTCILVALFYRDIEEGINLWEEVM